MTDQDKADAAYLALLPLIMDNPGRITGLATITPVLDRLALAQTLALCAVRSWPDSSKLSYEPEVTQIPEGETAIEENPIVSGYQSFIKDGGL